MTSDIKTYQITWLFGYGSHDGKSETHSQNWFSAENGFENEYDMGHFENLAVGSSMKMGGISDCVEIRRIT